MYELREPAIWITLYTVFGTCQIHNMFLTLLCLMCSKCCGNLGLHEI